MKQGLIPWIGGAALTGGAVLLSGPQRDAVLIGLMLCYPLLDRAWRPPSVSRDVRWRWLVVIMCLLIAALLVWRQYAVSLFVSTLFLAALPEEWFFRAYFMSSIGSGWPANLLTSLLFALLHGLTHDWLTAVLVFWPSLFYGWLYQRTRDLPLLVLAHALSNLIYMLGFGAWLYQWLAPLLTTSGYIP